MNLALTSMSTSHGITSQVWWRFLPSVKIHWWKVCELWVCSREHKKEGPLLWRLTSGDGGSHSIGHSGSRRWWCRQGGELAGGGSDQGCKKSTAEDSGRGRSFWATRTSNKRMPRAPWSWSSRVWFDGSKVARTSVGQTTCGGGQSDTDSSTEIQKCKRCGTSHGFDLHPSSLAWHPGHASTSWQSQRDPEFGIQTLDSSSRSSTINNGRGWTPNKRPGRGGAQCGEGLSKNISEVCITP